MEGGITASDGPGRPWNEGGANEVDGAPESGESGSNTSSGRTTELGPGAFITAFAIDANTVYWVDTHFSGFDPNDGDVMRVPSAGGIPTTLATGSAFIFGDAALPMDPSQLNGPTSIAVDSADVYWTNQGSGNGLDGSLRKMPIDGSATPVKLASCACTGVALDNSNVYWTDGNKVMAAPKLGGMPTMLAVANAIPTRGIVVGGMSVYFLDSGTNGQDGRVMKVSTQGGPPVTLASGQVGPVAIVIDNANVYWTTESGNIMKVAASGAAPPVVLASGELDPSGIYLRGIAVDGTSVYWTNASAVKKMGLDGENPTTLAAADRPLEVAVDTTSVYWNSVEGQSVTEYSPK
jgi:hypothetical protein